MASALGRETRNKKKLGKKHMYRISSNKKKWKVGKTVPSERKLASEVFLTLNLKRVHQIYCVFALVIELTT